MYVIRILVVYFLYFRLLVNPFFFLFDNKFSDGAKNAVGNVGRSGKFIFAISAL